METRTHPQFNITTALFVIDGVESAYTSALAADAIVGAETEWTILAVVRKHLMHTSGATGFASPVLTPEEMHHLAIADLVAGDAATAGTARAFGGRPVTQTVAQGTPVAGVRRHLAEYPTDLVVVDSPELAEHLVGDGIDPVLVIPRTPLGSWTGPVLLALDDSTLDHAVLETAARLFNESTTDFVAVHVDAARTIAQAVPVATVAPGALGDSMMSTLVDDLDSASVAAERVVRAAVAASDLDRVDVVGEVGDPAAAILLAAKEHDASMIVLGAHGRGWISRLVRPSVADAVLQQTHRPVLVLANASQPETA